MRTELKLGLLVYAAAFGLNCFVPLPELVLGAASALALCLDVIGILPQPLYQLSLIHICRCRRLERCRSRWSPYH